MVCWLVGLSFIISSTGGKLHFHAPSHFTYLIPDSSLTLKCLAHLKLIFLIINFRCSQFLIDLHEVESIGRFLLEILEVEPIVDFFEAVVIHDAKLIVEIFEVEPFGRNP